MTRILLLGRTAFEPQEWQTIVGPGVALATGTTIESVDDAFRAGPVDHVIMGAGLDLEARLEIVRAVFERSGSTTVHLKDRDSGREGMKMFVRGIVSGLARNE